MKNRSRKTQRPRNFIDSASHNSHHRLVRELLFLIYSYFAWYLAFRNTAVKSLSWEKIQNMQPNSTEFISWLIVLAQMASVFFNNKYENNNSLTSLW